MRISDWSSDVCSSDLPCAAFVVVTVFGLRAQRARHRFDHLVGRLAEQEVAGGAARRDEGESFAGQCEMNSRRRRCRRLRRRGSFRRGRLRRCRGRSEEHTSELQSLMRISYAVFCLKKKNNNKQRAQNKKVSEIQD